MITHYMTVLHIGSDAEKLKGGQKMPPDSNRVNSFAKNWGGGSDSGPPAPPPVPASLICT